jgi:hypothetical protein
MAIVAVFFVSFAAIADAQVVRPVETYEIPVKGATVSDSVFTGKSLANPNGYYPYVIARPGDRQLIRNMPIQQRPTRPMHFYGNRVRKTYSVGPAVRVVPTVGPFPEPLTLRRR